MIGKVTIISLSLCFFFLCAFVVYLKSNCLCFGLSSLILVMIVAFCNCKCVYVSVSSFVKKTTEKINTLQMNADLWPRPDLREGVQGEVTATASPLPEEGEHEWVMSAAIGGFIYLYCLICGFWLSLSIRMTAEQSSSESELQELRAATKKAMWVASDCCIQAGRCLSYLNYKLMNVYILYINERWSYARSAVMNYIVKKDFYFK